jgi:ketosteroid isomerase-like protein
MTKLDSLRERGHRMSNVDVVKGLYDAFARGDVPGVLGAMAPDIEWREAENNPYKMDGQPWKGPDQITQELFMKLMSEWEGFTATPKTYHDAGDTVIVEGRYTAKNNSTGKNLDAQFCHIWKVADGKLASFQQYGDTAQLQDTMGKG